MVWKCAFVHIELDVLWIFLQFVTRLFLASTPIFLYQLMDERPTLTSLSQALCYSSTISTMKISLSSHSSMNPLSSVFPLRYESNYFAVGRTAVRSSLKSIVRSSKWTQKEYDLDWPISEARTCQWHRVWLSVWTDRGHLGFSPGWNPNRAFSFRVHPWIECKQLRLLCLSKCWPSEWAPGTDP